MKRAVVFCSVGLLLASGCTTVVGDPVRADRSAVTLEVEGVIDPDATKLPNYYRLALPPGMPPEVFDELRMQLLPSFGREDLVAASNAEYAPAACSSPTPSVAGQELVLDAIAAEAAKTSIVIVNESHVVSRHRGFIEDVLQRLRPLGYSVYAAETFRNQLAVPRPIEQGATLPYARIGDGHYSAEPAFGRLIRSAKTLGYRLVPYEMVFAGNPDPAGDRVAQMNEREATQSDNLARFLSEAPRGTKMVVHVGYSHASEAETGGVEWMALRLKRATGADPLTIGQTDCRGGGESVRLANGDAKRKAGTFDINVDHPVTEFRHGRPEWRFVKGDLPVAIPPTLRPTEGAYIVEARLAGEPEEAVPVDRVYVRAGEDVMLALPPGHYRVRAVRTEI